MKKIAVFPGSFDPITLAHLDLIERGLHLFDKIVIAVGVNHSKKGRFDLETRVAMIQDAVRHLPSDRVEAKHFQGLTVDFCRAVHADFILRGMRNTQDFEAEKAIAWNNTDLAPAIQSVFLLSHGRHSHISSTIIREIMANGGRVDHLVPASVLAAYRSD